jgi:hypothetical protein
VVRRIAPGLRIEILTMMCTPPFPGSGRMPIRVRVRPRSNPHERLVCAQHRRECEGGCNLTGAVYALYVGRITGTAAVSL